eukprot:scaffold3886_cov58-Cyclotella_meneghiniana.AAC.2
MSTITSFFETQYISQEATELILTKESPTVIQFAAITSNRVFTCVIPNHIHTALAIIYRFRLQREPSITNGSLRLQVSQAHPSALLLLPVHLHPQDHPSNQRQCHYLSLSPVKSTKQNTLPSSLPSESPSRPSIIPPPFLTASSSSPSIPPSVSPITMPITNPSMNPSSSLVVHSLPSSMSLFCNPNYLFANSSSALPCSSPFTTSPADQPINSPSITLHTNPFKSPSTMPSLTTLAVTPKVQPVVLLHQTSRQYYIQPANEVYFYPTFSKTPENEVLEGATISITHQQPIVLDTTSSIPSCQLLLNSSTSISLIRQNETNPILYTHSSPVFTTTSLLHFCFCSLALFLILHVKFNTTKVFLQLCDQSSWIFPWHLLERECGGRNTGTEGGQQLPSLLEALRALRKKSIFCYTPPQTAGPSSEWRGERFLADRPPNALRRSIKMFKHRLIRPCECKSSSLVMRF